MTPTTQAAPDSFDQIPHAISANVCASTICVRRKIDMPATNLTTASPTLPGIDSADELTHDTTVGFGLVHATELTSIGRAD